LALTYNEPSLFKHSFHNIVALSFTFGRKRSIWRKNAINACRWQTVSHKVVSSTPCHERKLKSPGVTPGSMMGPVVLCCAFRFICLRPVCWVPDAAAISGLLILDW